MNIRLIASFVLTLVFCGGTGILTGLLMAQDLKTPYELSGKTRSPEYDDGLAYYRKLAQKFPEIKIEEFGRTDSGYPLHLVLVSIDKDFDVESNRKKGRAVLLVNNAIHPGETDGVDASMMFVRDLLLQKEKQAETLDKILLAVIPYYNIGGALNRNRFSRANQNGPVEYGFRGNARNYDLNRDFIKSDTRNARAFARIFHKLDPDLFIDTHVSNGADYQFVMTTAHAQKDKLGGKLGEYLHQEMMPFIYQHMESKGFPTVPYVNVFGRAPDEGYEQFLDLPRYSTGYAALFQTPGIMSETHMLKPYPQRVDATYQMLAGMLRLAAKDGEKIRMLRIETRMAQRKQKEFPVTWKLDRSRHTDLEFKGYEAVYRKSRVTGNQRLFYDRSKPYSRTIKFYNHYVADKTVKKPKAYLIPRGWHSVVELLRLNGVEVEELKKEQEFQVEVYRIAEYTSLPTPFEGHYLHDTVKLETQRQKVKMRKGDFLVTLDQDRVRYIVETLEPQAADSFFRWNFFDTILQRKEHFSPYVFEQEALQLLEDDADLKKNFEAKKESDKDFADNWYAQLDYLYQHSRHYEKAHMRYPVFRVID